MPRNCNAHRTSKRRSLPTLEIDWIRYFEYWGQRKKEKNCFPHVVVLSCCAGKRTGGCVVFNWAKKKERHRAAIESLPACKHAHLSLNLPRLDYIHKQILLVWCGFVVCLLSGNHCFCFLGWDCPWWICSFPGFLFFLGGQR